MKVLPFHLFVSHIGLEITELDHSVPVSFSLIRCNQKELTVVAAARQ
jgi:hypothetical protein